MNTFTEFPKSAVIQLATDQPNGSKLHIPCEVQEMEADRLALEVGPRLSIFAAVMVECNDALFLGEVLSCRPRPSGTYEVQVKVEQILTGLQSLVGLRARLLGEGVPHAAFDRPPVPVLSGKKI